MRTYFKANVVLERHMVLAQQLKESPEYGKLMRPDTRDAVLEMAAEITPAWRTMLKRPERPLAEKEAALANVRLKTALLRLLRGLQYWFFGEKAPPSLQNLVRFRLGASPRENVNRLVDVLHALEDMPEFPWPPGHTMAEARAVVAEAKLAQTNLLALRRDLKDAKRQLQLLRPRVVALWKAQHLEEWIIATIPSTERAAWGLPPRQQRRRKTRGALAASSSPGLAEIVDFDEAAAIGRKSVPPDR